jgi:hypothetical protein
LIGELASVNEFYFESAPEALLYGVVVAVTVSAHGRGQTGSFQCCPNVTSSVLFTPVVLNSRLGGGVQSKVAMARAAKTNAESNVWLMAQPTIIRLWRYRVPVT